MQTLQDISISEVKQSILSTLGVPSYSSFFEFRKEQPTMILFREEKDYDWNHIVGIHYYSFNEKNIHIHIGYNSDMDNFSILIKYPKGEEEFYFKSKDNSVSGYKGFVDLLSRLI